MAACLAGLAITGTAGAQQPAPSPASSPPPLSRPALPAPAAPIIYDAVIVPTGITQSGLAPRGESLADVVIRPTSAVVLGGTLDDRTAKQAAVTKGFAFTPGRMLFGTREASGLYCDLMRNRGLGSSTACLNDSDGDGLFDEAVRYDFNSGRADRVFITDKGKLRGGKLKKRFPLAQKLAYAPALNADLPEARISLRWANESPGALRPGQSPRVELLATDGDNFTGTQIMSSIYALVPMTDGSQVLNFYGSRIKLTGFAADGALRFNLVASPDPQPMGLVFRGYQLFIIGY